MAKKLRVEELAKRLGLNCATIRRWARNGKLPCQRLGLRPIWFDEEEVETALKATSSAQRMGGK
jgi:excisionase family DNA binding protein